ncbi:unnamed protein product [Ceutorhynchus assimilis]|uniref:Uncharacterized protein n=1 Tax=Ceutorhynchus assimilis TaxID=467358 RepID=A0A9N9MLL4_9CUCU|nr:unnamed protein product [Ceutorhynchus assimilis]
MYALTAITLIGALAFAHAGGIGVGLAGSIDSAATLIGPSGTVSRSGLAAVGPIAGPGAIIAGAAPGVISAGGIGLGVGGLGVGGLGVGLGLGGLGLNGLGLAGNQLAVKALGLEGSGIEGQWIPDINEQLHDDGSWRPDVHG